MGQLAQKRSVLDAVLTDANDLQRGLTKADTDKLDEYFQSIRDIETRLGKDEQWLNIPKSKAALAEPKEGLSGRDEVRVVYPKNGNGESDAGGIIAISQHLR